MKKVAVIGASGYAGRELCGLLEGHPELHLQLRMSARKQPAQPDSELDPSIMPLDTDALEGLDGVFLCTPHGAASAVARAGLDAGAVVVDLSADFRLRDPARYEATYGAPHPAPDLLDVAVYGLTEHARRDLAGARLVANPGCYPTAVLLPLLPLQATELLVPGAPIIADCKSGVSGAGKQASQTTHFGNVHENMKAYAVGTHRHTPEIQQVAENERIVFVPHLLPVFRGLMATLYLTPAAGVSAARIRECLADDYRGEPFVRVLKAELPELARVQHTNQCHIGVADAYGQVVVVSAIDNLVKGAAGQALQNMNRLLGLDETSGLERGASARQGTP